METVKSELVRDMSWLKGLLNNIPLLKWVRKFSADKLFEDNRLATSFGVRCNEDSISVANDTLTQVLVTHSRFGDKEYVRFNLKQIAEVIQLLGVKGELIITERKVRKDAKGVEISELPNMMIQIDDTTVIVCPLPEQDVKK